MFTFKRVEATSLLLSFLEKWFQLIIKIDAYFLNNNNHFSSGMDSLNKPVDKLTEWLTVQLDALWQVLPVTQRWKIAETQNVWPHLKHLLHLINVFAKRLVLESWVIVPSKSLFQEHECFLVARNLKGEAKQAVSAFHSASRNQFDVKTFGCDKQHVDWCPAPGEPQIAAGQLLCALWIAAPRHRPSVLPHDKQLLNLN